MQISERKQIILDTLEHERILKERRVESIRHQEQRERDLEIEMKTRENRQLALVRHEENNKLNLEQRTKEVENHQEFMKSALRII